MRYKINLHAHSSYSDGGHTLSEMFLQYKELGFKVATFTDHYYNKPGERCNISLDREKIAAQREEAKRLGRFFNMGVICGIEIGINRLEEVVVIGEKAIDAIVDLREQRYDEMDDGTINIVDLLEIKKKHRCMINLCHPSRPYCWVEKGGHHVLDGFEYIHAGTLMFDRWRSTSDTPERKVPEEFLGKTKLCNSDAHSKSCLEWCWNEVEADIRNEHDLLGYVENGGLWHPVSSVRDNW